MSTVTDLCSIGTLFAFVLVCAGVLRLESMGVERTFKTPYVNSQWIAPAGVILAIILTYRYNQNGFMNFLTSTPATGSEMSSLSVFLHNIPLWIFVIITLILTGLCMVRKYSLIPVLGLVSCLYMMSQIELKNWVGFMVWLAIGLVLYFSYGYKNSKLAKQAANS